MRLFLLLLLLVSSGYLRADASASVELDKQPLPSGKEIYGRLTIIHEPSQHIDLENIKIGTSPLRVSVKSIDKIGKEEKVVLEFKLPPQEKGLQVLPVISIPVGGSSVATVSQTYMVNGGIPSSSSAKYGMTKQQNTIWLKLETFIEGKSTLLPGQRTIVGYRYIFNGNIQLGDEFLPLLEADGFKKIGEPNIQDLKENRFAIRQVAQEIEADKPGEYQFPESKVAGNVYTTVAGQQTLQDKIEATAPPVTITVKAFPDENKPASFNGAIGNYTFNVRLLSLPEVSVGDKLTLSIEMTGKGDLDDLPMPEVCCQPGFSGNFEQSDIPPAGIVKGDSKAFVVDIRPLSEKLTEIPSLEFSFYNPDTNKYVALKSTPIPITVHPSDTYNKALQSAETPANEDKSPAQKASPKDEQEPTKGIEISGNVRLSNDDLHDRLFSTWWTLIIIPLIAAALWLQTQMKKALENKNLSQNTDNSETWMKNAKSAGNDLAKISHSLDRAFIHLLKEKGLIESTDITPHELSTEGAVGDVREFLIGIEENRFAGKGNLSPQKVLSDAQKLYDDIKHSTVS